MRLAGKCWRQVRSFSLVGLFVGLTSGAAGPLPRIHGNISDSQTFVLPGNTRPVVMRGVARDEGKVAGSQAMPRMSLHFTMTAAQQADLEQLLKGQADRRSPQYQKFLTPEEFAARFGVSSSDIEKVKRWLENSGFKDLQVGRSGTWVQFSGTATQAETAFRIAVHRYSLDGETHLANATDPHLPKALEGMVSAVGGLHNFAMKPQLVRAHPNFTSSISGNHYLAPDDWETIYDVKPLYGAGFDGTGVTIAVVGQSDVQLSDIAAFRAAANLPAKAPTVVIPPGSVDPGFHTNDETESDLDIEWSGAIAMNANILFITASSTVGNGVEDAMVYAIDNNVAPILSVSYGLCEPEETTSDVQMLNGLFQQAVAQGMTVVAASGDAGATACDIANTETAATQGLAVNFPASSPYVTGVGGTVLYDYNGTYWSFSNNASGGSVTSYIPELGWDDGFQAASGGGASILFSKPSWQTGTAVPNDNARDVPDVAFTASADHDGLLFCGHSFCTSGFRNSSSNLDVIGGTSTGAPTFAGVLALTIQSNGSVSGLGNLNPNLYSLVQIVPSVFHDVTAGVNNQVCQAGTTDCPNGGSIGYNAAGAGYDQVTGWGSVDAYNFAQQWFRDFQLSASPAAVTIQPGSSATTTVTILPLNNFAGSVTLTCSVASALIDVTCSVPATAVNGSGTVTVTITAANTARGPWWTRFRQLPPPAVQVWLPLGLLSLTVALMPLRKARRTVNATCLGGCVCMMLVFVEVSCGGAGSTAVSVGGGSGTPTPAPTLVLTCSLPGNALQGTAYSGSCVGSGGTGAFSYSISGGALPAGLAINSTNGTISGTPTTPGTSSFTVSVSDSGTPQQTATVAENNFVVASDAAPLILSCNYPSAMTGVAYSGTCSATGGTGKVTYYFTGTIPSGLTFDSTGALKGTPVSPGTVSFVIHGTDGGVPQQSATVNEANFGVAAGQLSLTCPLASSVPVNQPISVYCVAVGGTPLFTYTVSSGKLPTGLSLDSYFGNIGGVPTVTNVGSPATFTLKVIDSGSPAQAATYVVPSFTVYPVNPLSIDCSGLPGGQLGVPYSSGGCLAIGGNTPYYLYTLGSGSLPGGLSISNSSGQIQGTPTTLGTSLFAVKVFDSSLPPLSAQGSASITIAARASETGLVTVTAKSGAVMNTAVIAVTVP